MKNWRNIIALKRDFRRIRIGNNPGSALNAF
jgi:hypothetical protein